ncbi:Glycosyltransferase involved in cell wall bisynthesis [Devosia crocina]|uniref:Glycosyltransferase involved in cell wall bisynthesis n=1 Tax=Devosia crocina TaxID=429728 RepID=A0A1I7NRA7_9HYPH|nr:glycosyltransferase family 4 protein [Devosia crocina]SFV37224.1 Glycosyltransferase involved in cell wall bisynthesis [Devosia crocina]
MTAHTDERVVLQGASPAGANRPYVMIAGLRSMEAQGGIETHVRELALRLARRDVDVEVVERLPYAPEPGILGGVRRSPLWSLRSSRLEAMSNTFAAVLWAIRRRPDVLHIHGIGPALMTPLAKLAGLRVVVTHHGRDYEREKWGTFAKLALRLGEWFALRVAHEVIAVSTSLSGELSRAGGRVVHGIPNGVKPSVPVGEPQPPLDFPYVLAVGRQVPEKRHLDLIRAFAAKDRGGLHLVIAGGADHQSAYSEELARVAAEHGNIHLLGPRPWDEIQTLYASASLFVLPSSHEGLPIVLLEAMSAGCPVLVSDIAPHLEVDLPDECYFPLGDLPALSDRIGALAAPEGQRVDWTQKLTRYDWDVIVEHTLSVYDVR